MNWKILISLVLFFSGLTTSANCAEKANEDRNKIVPFPKHAESEVFFSSRNDSIVIHGVEADPKVFGDLNDSAKRIRKIPVSFLAETGLKEGTVIQSINVVKGGAKTTYTLGKEVNVLMMPNNSMKNESPYWTRFHLIISDDPKEHEKLKSKDTSYTGFAYAGKGLILKEGEEHKTPLEKNVKPHSVFKKYFADLAKNGKIKGSSILGSKLFIHIDHSEGKRAYSGFVESNGKYYNIETNNRMVTSDGEAVILGDWINGARTIYYGDTLGTDQCYNLIIFENGKVSKVELPCTDRED